MFLPRPDFVMVHLVRVVVELLFQAQLSKIYHYGPSSTMPEQYLHSIQRLEPGKSYVLKCNYSLTPWPTFGSGSPTLSMLLFGVAELNTYRLRLYVLH